MTRGRNYCSVLFIVSLWDSSTCVAASVVIASLVVAAQNVVGADSRMKPLWQLFTPNYYPVVRGLFVFNGVWE